MSRKCAVVVAVWAVLGLTASSVVAAPPLVAVRSDEAGVRSSAAVPVIRDVALQAGNALHGQVVDSEGMAQANFEVWVTREDGPSLRTRTDANGRFLMAELPAGLYRIETAAGGSKFRLWAPKTAPSDAQSNVLLVVRTRLAG